MIRISSPKRPWQKDRKKWDPTQALRDSRVIVKKKVVREIDSQPAEFFFSSVGAPATPAAPLTPLAPLAPLAQPFPISVTLEGQEYNDLMQTN